MHYCGLNTCDTANGEGVRVSLFVSGCTLHCKGCFNKDAWDFSYGEEFTTETFWKIYDALAEEYVSGLSILGGDPLENANIDEVTKLCRRLKDFYPDKTIWLYTGRKFSKVKDLPIFRYIDVVVDGAFIESKKVHNEFYGSSNQRIIYLKNEEHTDNPKEVI